MRKQWVTATALALSLIAGGCARQPEAVEPGVLQEVGKIGTIIWRERDTGLSGVETVVTDIFLIDVGGETEEASLRKAVAFLRSRGWVTSVDDSPRNVWLQSPKWKGANLGVSSLRASPEYEQPAVKQTIERQGVDPDALVTVSAYVGW
ncbi:hypothetical protein WBK31_12660 [Nonomuraea sp. N2-4H]|jgi:hypothetical protein|uniref:hypothetical protein n=1 Tax=Nonomuraea sp. N2-4H TaxID=3128898 RepID=UPI0032489390